LIVSRVDLHCHTSASFDGVAAPDAVVARAVERGLTHLAITDHDTLDGAMRAVDAAPAGLHVIVGCEVSTPEGDLVFVFLGQALPRDLSAREAIAAGREQGALVGIPHPFDRDRRSLLRDPANEELASEVDWIEAWNGRVATDAVNRQAARLVQRLGAPGVCVSDAHALLEVGTAWTSMEGDPSTPGGLLAALHGPLAIMGLPSKPATGQLERLLGPGKRRFRTGR
jgi:predicted metal-dependent phosphoesterase TrpH